MKSIIAVTSFVLLAACQAPGPAKPEATDLCGASNWQHLLGTSASGLDVPVLPKGTRMLHPDTPTTRDYRLDRMNVHVDADGRVSRVVCG